MILYADTAGERLDAFLARSVEDLSRSGAQKLLEEGWLLEGVAFNSGREDEVPQYRLHNPNATRGAYHFTASIEERDFLIAIGWEYQGIGFYSSWK